MDSSERDVGRFTITIDTRGAEESLARVRCQLQEVIDMAEKAKALLAEVAPAPRPDISDG